MNSPEEQYYAIANKFTSKDEEVHHGKMMHSPGLKCRDMVFAFYHKEAMGFRLGPNFNAEKMGVPNAKPLSPFKTKPPLKGWFVIEKHEMDAWDMLAELALEYTKTIN